MGMGWRNWWNYSGLSAIAQYIWVQLEPWSWNVLLHRLLQEVKDAPPDLHPKSPTQGQSLSTSIPSPLELVLGLLPWQAPQKSPPHHLNRSEDTITLKLANAVIHSSIATFTKGNIINFPWPLWSAYVPGLGQRPGLPLLDKNIRKWHILYGSIWFMETYRVQITCQLHMANLLSVQNHGPPKNNTSSYTSLWLFLLS